MSRILILLSNDSSRLPLAEWLEADGHRVQIATVADLDQLDSLSDFNLIVADDVSAEHLLAEAAPAPLLVIARNATVPAAVKAIKAGASHYQAEPATPDELQLPVRELLTELSSDPGSDFSLGGNSPPMSALLEHIRKVGPTDSTVLITGESGTGKELVARALHASSQRRLAALISVNCAAIPPHLIDTELFGHNESNQRGLLEAAEGGTLFLDEIGELPMEVQGRLLHVLAGDSVNVRLIAATHRDLQALIDTQQFRQDLYYRLKVVSLDIPPLRERGEDILPLAEDILTRTSRRLGKNLPSFNDDARRSLTAYHWPGNVRELENAIERAVILGEDIISTALLAIEPTEPKPQTAAGPAPDQTMEDYFVSFVTAHQDQLTETELAERLGISRKSLWERRQRLNIPRKKTRKRGPRRDVS